MDRNEMPCAPGTGHINVLDDESISRNVSAIRAILAKSNLIIGKSSPLITNYDILDIGKMLREQRKRRDDAALRLPPMRCGCHDPLRCTCYTKRGAR